MILMDWTLDAATLHEVSASGFRAIGLTIAFFLVPRGSLPGIAKVAVWSAALMCTPFKTIDIGFGGLLVGLDSSVSEIVRGSFLPYTAILLESGIGVLLGISFGASLLLASIFGHMLSASIIQRTGFPLTRVEIRPHPQLSVLPVLICFSLILGSGAYATVFAQVADSYASLPLGFTELPAGGFVAVCEVVLRAGATALMLATYLFLPLALLFFVCDLSCIFSYRVFRELEAHWFFKGLRIPLLSLFLVLSLYPFSEQLGAFFVSSNGPQASKTITNLFHVHER